MIKASKQEEGKRVNLHVMETEQEVKNFHKNFHDILERAKMGVGVKTKHI